ncbi:hypothetical protein HN51_042143 [Arachis hypogaea]
MKTLNKKRVKIYTLRLCALSISLTGSRPHLTSSLFHLSPHLDSHHSQSLTPHFVALSVSHLVPSSRSSPRSCAPVFGSSAAEADGISQAAAAPSGGGRRHLVSRQTRCRNQSIRVVELEKI